VVIVINGLIFRRLIPPRQAAATGGGASVREIRRFVALDYVSSLFLQTYTTALPVLIVALLGAEANAAFYVAYVVVSTLDLVAVNLSTSLVIESSHEEARLAEYTRRVLRRTGALVLVAVAFLVVAASQLPVVFGHHYSGDASTLLRLLALGSLPRVVGIVYMGAMRVERRVGRVVAVQGATSLIVVTLTLVLGPVLGIRGVGIAWAAGHGAVAIALLPWLRRTLRSGAHG
jgi:O-antigen/teichoic acid export membrane protein